MKTSDATFGGHRTGNMSDMDYATKLAMENAALRECLRALVEDEIKTDQNKYYTLQAGCTSNEFTCYCIYCRANSGEDYGDVTHAPDCPITLGRALLAKGAR